MNKAEKSRKYLFFSLILFLLGFYVILHYRIKHWRASIHSQLTVFDFAHANDNFFVEFSRVRAYIKMLADHYGCPSRKRELNGDLKEYNESVMAYCNDKTDANYEGISRLIERIISTEYSDALKQLVLMDCDPLTLAIFLIAPIPSKNLIPAQSALLLHSRVKTEPLMKFLATLRQPNIFRSFFNIHSWMRAYDNDAAEFSRFGNVFSYENTAGITVARRLKKLLPRLSTESEDIRNILIDYPGVKTFKAPKKFILTVTIENIINKTLGDIGSLKLVIVETWPKSIKYFSQISEKLKRSDNSAFHLSVMIIEKNPGSLRIMIFDKSFQIWTMFTEDGRVLSMPRQMARLFYVLYGKYLIYSAQ